MSDLKPVAWRYRGEFCGNKLPWQHTGEEWLANKQREHGEEVEALYAAAAIDALVASLGFMTDVYESGYGGLGCDASKDIELTKARALLAALPAPPVNGG